LKDEHVAALVIVFSFFVREARADA